MKVHFAGHEDVGMSKPLKKAEVKYVLGSFYQIRRYKDQHAIDFVGNTCEFTCDTNYNSNSETFQCEPKCDLCYNLPGKLIFGTFLQFNDTHALPMWSLLTPK